MHKWITAKHIRWTLQKNSGAQHLSYSVIAFSNTRAPLVAHLSVVFKTKKKQVLFVAMDEVSFEFMDALDPGCATLFPRRASVSLIGLAS